MLYATLGQQEQAHTELPTAIAMSQSMAMTFWLPAAEAALAQVERRRSCPQWPSKPSWPVVTPHVSLADGGACGARSVP